MGGYYLVKEPFPKIDLSLLKKYDSNIYVQGYWQSQDYFSSIEEILLKELTFKNEPVELTEPLKSLNSEKVAIHIRRGDFVDDMANKKIYVDLTETNYYNEAVDWMSKRLENPIFILFSDDIKWCRENLHFGFTPVYSWGSSPMEDFYLMSQCDHNIIANSTFSWWAARLNTKADKFVLCPSKWYQNGWRSMNIVPNDWSVI